MLPRRNIRCAQHHYHCYGMLYAKHAISCAKTNTSLLMEENNIPHDGCHLGVTSGVPNTITIAMVCSTQTMHLSCAETNISLLMEENNIPHDRCHLRVTSGVPNTITISMVCSTQTVHQSCAQTNTSLLMDQNKIPHD